MDSSIISFPQFIFLPGEIQLLVMTHCLPNDLICLRLTCKTLYHYSPIKLKHRLSHTDRDISCCTDPSENSTNFRSALSNHCFHRQTCHKLTYEHLKKQAEANQASLPPEKPKCRTGRQSDHCECFDRRSKLHSRLRSWMPRVLKYCRDCDMFTRRKWGHKGICYHGRPKPRQAYKSSNWTHRSRNGGFGYRTWRKWFNGAAISNLESRMSEPQLRNDSGSRYNLRNLQGKKAKTRMMS